MNQSKIFWKAFIKIFALFTGLVFITDQQIFLNYKLILLMILVNSIVAVLIALPFSFFKKNKKLSPETWDTLSNNPKKIFRGFLFHFILNTLVLGTIANYFLQTSHATPPLFVTTLLFVLVISYTDAWFRFYKS